MSVTEKSLTELFGGSDDEAGSKLFSVFSHFGFLGNWRAACGRADGLDRGFDRKWN